MERDILADVNHPFVVKLHYGESASRPEPGMTDFPTLLLLQMPENAFCSRLIESLRLQRSRLKGSST